MKTMLSMVLVCVLAGGLSAAWMDDFEYGDPFGYGYWGPLPAPWEDASSQGSYPDNGYGGSMGCYGPGSGWYFGHAWRPTDSGANVITAKVSIDSGFTYQGAAIGFTPDKTYGGNGRFCDLTDTATMMLNGDGSGTAASLLFWVTDCEAGSWVGDTRFTVNGLSADVWYDFRLTLDSGQVTGEYKEVSSSTWNTVGTLTPYDDFAPNYVGVSGLRGGFMDDVANVPEPLTLVLLSAGGLLLRRKRA